MHVFSSNICENVYKIDNLHVRLIFELSKKKVNSRKELIKISKIAKFGCEML
jgi:hypothetical protein